MNVQSTGQNQTFSFPRRSSSARSSETAAPRAAETECKTCHSKQGIKYSHTVQRVYTLCSLSGRTLKPHKRQKAPRFRLTANSAESTAEGLFCLPPECLRHMLAGSLYHASRMKSSAPIRKPKRQRMTTKQEQARRSERDQNAIRTRTENRQAIFARIRCRQALRRFCEVNFTKRREHPPNLAKCEIICRQRRR